MFTLVNNGWSKIILETDSLTFIHLIMNEFPKSHPHAIFISYPQQS